MLYIICITLFSSSQNDTDKMDLDAVFTNRYLSKLPARKCPLPELDRPV